MTDRTISLLCHMSLLSACGALGALPISPPAATIMASLSMAGALWALLAYRVPPRTTGPMET